MTTIVLHEGYISVDSQITFEGRKHFTDKFVDGDNGTLYIMCGSASNAREIVEALRRGFQDARPEPGTILIKIEDGTVQVLNSDGWYTPEKTEVWGSGGDAALAAILCGRSSRGACEVASQVDLYSGGMVHTFPVAGGKDL